MGDKNGGALRCNRIAVKDAIPEKILSHHFIKSPGYKIEILVLKRCSEKSIRITFVRKFIYQPEEISKNDRMFLTIVEKVIRRLMGIIKYDCHVKMEILSCPTIREKTSEECSN